MYIKSAFGTWLTAASLLLVLSACGGSGSNTQDTPVPVPAPPTGNDIPPAEQAEFNVLFWPSSQRSAISGSVVEWSYAFEKLQMEEGQNFEDIYEFEVEQIDGIAVTLNPFFIGQTHPVSAVLPTVTEASAVQIKATLTRKDDGAYSESILNIDVIPAPADEHVEFTTEAVFNNQKADTALEYQDFNNDGTPDFLLNNHWFQGDGNGNFSAGTRFPFAGDVVKTLDHNNDGMLDILVSESDTLFLLQQTENPNALFVVTHSITGDIQEVLCEDANSDGFVDLITYENNGNTSYLHLNHGGESFDEPKLLSSTYVSSNLYSLGPISHDAEFGQIKPGEKELMITSSILDVSQEYTLPLDQGVLAGNDFTLHDYAILDSGEDNTNDLLVVTREPSFDAQSNFTFSLYRPDGFSHKLVSQFQGPFTATDLSIKSVPAELHDSMVVFAYATGETLHHYTLDVNAPASPIFSQLHTITHYYDERVRGTDIELSIYNDGTDTSQLAILSYLYGDLANPVHRELRSVPFSNGAAIGPVKRLLFDTGSRDLQFAKVGSDPADHLIYHSGTFDFFTESWSSDNVYILGTSAGGFDSDVFDIESGTRLNSICYSNEQPQQILVTETLVALACSTQLQFLQFSPEGVWQVNSENANTDSFITLDINNDGEKEVVTSDAVFYIDNQGSIQREERDTNIQFLSPQIGDVDGDGIADLLSSCESFLCYQLGSVTGEFEGPIRTDIHANVVRIVPATNGAPSEILALAEFQTLTGYRLTEQGVFTVTREFNPLAENIVIDDFAVLSGSTPDSSELLLSYAQVGDSSTRALTLAKLTAPEDGELIHVFHQESGARWDLSSVKYGDDINGDGINDLLIKLSDSLSFDFALLYQSTGVWSHTWIDLEGVSDAVPFDHDRDGKYDVLATQKTDNELSITLLKNP